MKKKLFDAKTIRIILIAILIIASIFTVVFMLRNDESKSGTKTPPQTTQDKEELKDEPTDDKVSSLEVKEDDGTEENSVDVSGDWDGSNTTANKQDSNKEQHSDEQKYEEGKKEETNENNDVSEEDLDDDKSWGNIF